MLLKKISFIVIFSIFLPQAIYSSGSIERFFSTQLKNTPLPKKKKIHEIQSKNFQYTDKNNFMNNLKRPIVAGYGFKNIEEGPYIVVDDIGQKPFLRHYLYLWDNEFELSFDLTTKHCIGRYEILTFEAWPCPNSKTVQKRYQHCYNCNNFISFKPDFYNIHKEQLSLKQQKYNLQPHNVYLAYFGDDIIKVGTAHYQRNLTRWLEQGAIFATIIQNFDNAYDARLLEKTICSLGVLEGVRIDKKRKILEKGIDTDPALQYFTQESITLKDKIGIEQENEIINLLPYYFKEGKIPACMFKDISKLKNNEIKGIGIGLVGDSLFFSDQKSEEFFIISLKNFMGHEFKPHE